MKKYPLSTTAERAAGLIFSVVMLTALGFLLYYLRSNIVALVMTAMVVVIIAGVLLLYVLNVTKSVIVYEPDERVLKVKGFSERIIDLNKVSTLQTITVKSGHVLSRSLVFSNTEDEIVSVVPTYFTSNRGMAAEPMAKQMAADLGLNFQANVPEWEYDKKARMAHDIEVEKQQKEDSRKRREAKAALRVAKMRKKINNARNEDKR